MRFLFIVILLVIASIVKAGGTDSYELRKLRALDAAGKHEPAAEAALRALSDERPSDTAVLMRLGGVVSDRARQLEPGPSRKNLMREARTYYLSAKEHGFDDPLITTALAAISEDGTESVDRFSENQEIDRAMKQAEDAFGRHQFDRAIEGYHAVLKLQPTNYRATLDLGDAYFSSNRYDQAVAWFKKAIALEPNIETAYRYYGDALLRMGRKDDALDQFLSAVIAEPYNGYPWRGLQSGIRVFLLKPMPAAPDIPVAKITDGSKGPEIQITDAKDPLQISYSIARVEWREKNGNKRFPSGALRRQTLEEEVYALQTMLTVYSELKSATPTLDDGKISHSRQISLDELAEINSAGLLEAHVLFFRANKDIAQDYASYRDKNRGKLRRYLIKYYLHLP
jgi:tetratricopeptide (TPR) repeat protein